MQSALTPNEASLSLFCANQETWVDFIPTINVDERINLLSGQRIGPWQAGVSTRMPLWLARHLQTKSLGVISPASSNDNWMRVESLKHILAWENEHPTLWINGASKDNENGNENDFDASNTPYLPERYWELSQCYSTADNAAAVTALLQDLWDKRLDKLRSQFQTICKNDENVQAANVTGIGTAELAIMRRVIAETLTQKSALQRDATSPQKTTASNPSVATVTPSSTSIARSLRPRAAIRRFRREQSEAGVVVEETS